MKFLAFGTGSMGKRRIRCLQAICSKPEDIVGFDLRQDRRDEAARLYKVATMSTLDAIESAKVRALVVSTPPDKHRVYVEQGIEKGRPAERRHDRDRGRRSGPLQRRGCHCSPSFVTKDRCGEVSLPLRPLFSQEVIRHGVMTWIAPGWAHREAELEYTLRAALEVYRHALDEPIDNFSRAAR